MNWFKRKPIIIADEDIKTCMTFVNEYPEYASFSIEYDKGKKPKYRIYTKKLTLRSDDLRLMIEKLKPFKELIKGDLP